MVSGLRLSLMLPGLAALTVYLTPARAVKAEIWWFALLRCVMNRLGRAQYTPRTHPAATGNHSQHSPSLCSPFHCILRQSASICRILERHIDRQLHCSSLLILLRTYLVCRSHRLVRCCISFAILCSSRLLPRHTTSPDSLLRCVEVQDSVLLPFKQYG